MTNQYKVVPVSLGQSNERTIIPAVDPEGNIAEINEDQILSTYLCGAGATETHLVGFMAPYELQVEQVRQGAGILQSCVLMGEAQKEVPVFTDGQVLCIIAPSGWVFAGYAFAEGDYIRLEKSVCIRRWGTTTGLGQLQSGPRPETILDPYGVLRIHIRTVVASLEFDTKAWAKALKA